MKRSSGSAALFRLGFARLGFALALIGCGGPETFHFLGGHSGGTAGGSVFSTGGSTFPGTGGTGAVIGSGGRITSGGSTATGGGSGSGGRAATGGATASGGSAVSGGRSGSGGAGGGGGRAGTGGSSASGGRAGTGGGGGGNCIDAVQAAGYSSGSFMCANCRDNSTPLADKCMQMIDCLAPLWPCSGNCMTDCLNMVAGSGVLSGCVSDIVNAACN